MGLCNFFTIQGGNWKRIDLQENCMEAFISLKNFQISEPIVDYPRKHRRYSPIVDGSTCSGIIIGELGTMLCQTDEVGEERVIAFASRQF
jgi:hypothetical protein